MLKKISIGGGTHLRIRDGLILVSFLFLAIFGELATAQNAAAGSPARRIIASTRLLPPPAPQPAPSEPPPPPLVASEQPAPAPSQGQTPSTLPGQAGAAPLTPPAAAVAGTGNQRFLELRSFTNLTRVTGVARDRSFFTAGRNSGVDFSYLENFGIGMRRFEAVSVLHYTDDPRVDPEHSSVQRAYFRMNGPRSEYNSAIIW